MGRDKLEGSPGVGLSTARIRGEVFIENEFDNSLTDKEAVAELVSSILNDTFDLDRERIKCDILKT